MQTTLEQAPAPLGIEFDIRPPDQRRERRHAIPRGMRLRVQISREDELVDAELRDISRNGVGLISPRVIPPGASITFPFGSQRIFAQVRYCHPAGTSFVVGALISEVVAENGAFSPTLNV
jgi:PilZ domain